MRDGQPAYPRARDEKGRPRPLRLAGIDLCREFYFVRDRTRVLPPAAQLFLLHAAKESAG